MGGSTSKEVGTNIVNEMVATIITNITLTCANTASSEQDIDIQCTPPVDTSIKPVQPYENREACRTCMKNILANQLRAYDLQRSSWQFGGVKVNMPIDTDYATVIQQFIACGTTQCKACVFQNLSQSTIIQNVVDCQAANTITNVIDQKLTDSITQSLTNNQDFIPGLMQMLGASSTQQIISNLTNRISTKITQDVVAGVLNTIQNNQTLKLVNANVNGQTQQSTYTCAVTYLQKTDLFSSIFTDAQWQQLQDLYNQSNTTDALGNAAVKGLSSVTRFLSSAVGKVVVAMIVIVIVVFVIGIIMAIVFAVRKYLTKQKLGIK